MKLVLQTHFDEPVLDTLQINYPKRMNGPLRSERLREFTVKMFRQKHLTSDCTVHSDVSARSESTTDNFQNITRK